MVKFESEVYFVTRLESLLTYITNCFFFFFWTQIRTKENETAPKVEKWEWNALKNALDDSARVFLTSQDGFKEDHWLMNGRLIISTIAVLFSAYALYDDWIHPFPLSRSTLIACVVAYFLTILLLTWYTNYVERGCFAVAHCKDSSGRRIYWRMYSKQVQRPYEI